MDAASRHDRPDLVQELLEAGARAGAKDRQGKTALVLAAEADHGRVVAALRRAVAR